YRHYGPTIGFRLSVLPFGYSTIYSGRSPYYYNDGVYYRPYTNGGYEVAAPPLGAAVSKLPSGAKATVIDGQKYYELGGTFYQEEYSSNDKLSYRVVGTDGVLNTDNGNDVGPIVNDNNNNINNDNIINNNNSNSNDNIINNNNSINNDNVISNNAPVPLPGTRVDKLPEGSKVVVIDQQKYYV